ncbi:MAG TPA: MBOAT family O-acyltransferase [Acetobacteraceae bacterium]|nr:MBOAT family O-acyltransferase [Acetobacteraceae bacterium]
MLFNSFSFLVFLCLTLAVFAARPSRWRWAWLLTASLIFYGWLAPSNLLFLAAIGAAAYGCAWGIGHTPQPWLRRALLTTGLVGVLGALVAFKLYDFVAGEVEILLRWPAHALPRLGIAAPAGFSFYAFSAASYLIDTYASCARASAADGIASSHSRERRAATPQGRSETHSPAGSLLPATGTPHRRATRNDTASASLASRPVPAASLGDIALYIAWFPKILAGPIERAPHFLPQLRNGLRLDAVALVPSLQLIFWGLFKKVVIADNLAPIVDQGFRVAAYATPVDLLFSVYFFAFQIYCDFSGYTDIAIGVSQLFGLRLMENFRRPYLALSTAEFWSQRWHISLAAWFRDYLFIPLGGSRAGTVRRYLNIMLVFAVSGLWHAGLGYGVGWTFLVWGALNGFYQWAGIATAGLWRRLGTALPRVRDGTLLRIARTLLTFHLVLIAWVFFRAKSIPDALLILRRLTASVPELPSMLARFPYTVEQCTGVTLIALLLVIEILDERRPMADRLARAPVALRWTAYYACLFALLLLGRWQAREFIYMQF